MIYENLSELQTIINQEVRKFSNKTIWFRYRDKYIKKHYGITPEQYQELLNKQKHCCAICGKHETEFKRKFAIDHDHRTKEIFGLLCTHCNVNIIGRNRKPDIYLAAAKYLEKGTGWFVPERRKRYGRPRLAQNVKRKRKRRETIKSV